MKHCLVVDDAEIIRKVARAHLEQLGYSVSEARNGDDALTRTEFGTPDLILIDWHMPGTATRTIIEKMRRLRGRSRPFIIYMTTEHDLEDISAAKLAGADDYLLKPFDQVAFEAKINEVALHGRAA